MSNTTEYIPTVEAAQLLGLSTTTTLRYAKNPESGIRTRQEGRQRLFHRDDVLAFAAARREAELSVQATPLELNGPADPDLSAVIQEQQERLEAAERQIDDLQAQLATRLTPDEAILLRDEVARLQARLDVLMTVAPEPDTEEPKKKKKKKKKKKD